jgi:hypothetical protein
MEPRCPERLVITRALVSAIVEIFKARARLAAGEDPEQNSAALRAAKDAQKSAERELASHVKQHGCKA